jgi:adenine-specific DNA glycosylase
MITTDIMGTNKKIQNTTIFPFQSVLDWYKKHGRHDLPWRQIYDRPIKERLYKVWIAEVMLQQTQVDRVIGYYNRFLLKYPTIESLAETTYEELFPYYQGLGYYWRARRMIELAKVVIAKYDGIFSDEFEKLRKLPWIGQYTAQALLAFGYDKPALAMDANLEKIFKRYYYWSRYFFSMNNEKWMICSWFSGACERLGKPVKKIHYWTLNIEHWTFSHAWLKKHQ